MEKVVMDRARIILLPNEHPVKQAFRVCADREATWPGAARSIMQKLAPEGQARLPEVTEIDWPATIEEVRTDSEARKKVAAAYRRQVVKPAVQEYDGAWLRLHEGPRQLDPGRDEWDFVSLQEGVACPGELLMGLEDGPADWLCYRIWAVVRATQAHPWPIWGRGAGALSLAQCPLCGHGPADVRHVVLDCAGTDAAWRRATGKSRPPRPWQQLDEELWKELFTVDGRGRALRERTRIVGECFIEVQKRGRE